MISEDTFVELKSKNERKLGLKEYIQLRVYEAVTKHKQDAEQLRVEVKELTDERFHFES